uniref:Glycosyltransferase n=1 Tax=Panax ginseng TaxID=4054 RepID=A0A0D5ZDD9_PANGI|nr:UGTPg42 [Panax ginseng]
MGAELIFIPFPGAGHLISVVEIAKLLISRAEWLSITILVMKLSFDTGVAGYTQSLQKDAHNRIVFADLPQDESVISMIKTNKTSDRLSIFRAFIESQKTQVRDAVKGIVSRSESNKLAGFVIDMFCTPMIDVANEFRVPSYVFFTSGAAYLGLQFYHLSLDDEHKQDVIQYKDSDVELSVPCFVNPVPAKVLPSVMLIKEGSTMIQSISRRFKETKAILVNTFSELEPHAIKCLADNGKIPPVYHVGPIINLKSKEGTPQNHNSEDGIISWLDNQPPLSVVFLCFGSLGSFDEEQVKEIAYGLERSGQRFLWSLRPPPQPTELFGLPKEYENHNEVLPEGFIKRTTGIGKVIGWAPQVVVLSHPAVGGFVSHCGWNSTLESIWCGVPMATWPIHAEQQLNAFELVKELGMAVEIKMDYRKDSSIATEPLVVTADEIEKGIKCLMNAESEMRKKVKEMKEKSRMAMVDGGSSHISLGHFIEDVMGNIQERA